MSRDGSRTCSNPLGGGQPNIFIHFLKKTHEFKEILVREGAGAGSAPSKSATVMVFTVCKNDHIEKSSRVTKAFCNSCCIIKDLVFINTKSLVLSNTKSLVLCCW